ncbi:hypothetical protein CVT24_002598 [Panaeolus cyanescens]|uniref:Uncharacterized protein n=1 Tax=Panaeolus cyanescens TaxID=181874 RepID=A0A409WB13_9AGAR|nr:hypothetical protein CVT24_002598 [Panaeolus cyanescens]
MDTVSFTGDLFCTGEETFAIASPEHHFEHSTFKAYQPSGTFDMKGPSKDVNQVDAGNAYLYNDVLCSKWTGPHSEYYDSVIEGRTESTDAGFNQNSHAFDASAQFMDNVNDVIQFEEAMPEDAAAAYAYASPALSSTSFYTDNTASPSYSADADDESSESSEWSECITPSPPCEFPPQVNNNEQGSLPRSALLFTPLSSTPFYPDGEATSTTPLAGTNQWNEMWEDDANDIPHPVLAQEEQRFCKDYVQNEVSQVDCQHEQPQWMWNSYMPNQETFNETQTQGREGGAHGTHNVDLGFEGGMNDSTKSAIAEWCASVDPNYNEWENYSSDNSRFSSNWGSNLSTPINYPGEFAATTHDHQLQLQNPGNVTHLHAYGNGPESTEPVVHPFAAVPQVQQPVNYNMTGMHSSPLSGSFSQENQFLANMGGHPVIMNLNFGNGAQVHFHFHNHSQ